MAENPYRCDYPVDFPGHERTLHWQYRQLGQKLNELGWDIRAEYAPLIQRSTQMYGINLVIGLVVLLILVILLLRLL